ncbi:hypothetical protein A2810_03050 [candidate division Kazan bacterium RIFCSPHIGHO2_01_FULL_49_10]|uniref:Uncharacterized protein n=1 Tax=candidate division Kazan bacterium RIFCSPLOWO2_01_FULL_48_13 TaxID=1798539 RepID=A0A1F4PQM5_UNCK3|nr:MAG: hypothetical protein A2810_03050 [candidate division Kazan bacterium RIFCSPHIGHO2_01_FULL_49_10]OGB85342.1 MAG: hypothetical protein A2994_01780 [candidate division Kazan bacterium RIFCSPLOWO2_01_FULL_48_13]
MKKAIDAFLDEHIVGKRLPIVVSLDLDNTLVIRDKGSNYINKKVKAIIKSLVSDKLIILLPNTGRDLLGFSAFSRSFLNLRNAVLYSGGLIVHNSKKYINKNSIIDRVALRHLLKGVESGQLPFVDLSYPKGRIVYYNDHALDYRDLFFAQNPRDWFKGGQLPPIRNIRRLSDKGLREVLRVEFPVIRSWVGHRLLFERLTAKTEHNISQLGRLLGVRGNDIFRNYSLKRKVFFSDKYDKHDLIFARLSKLTTFVNKGIGLKEWLARAKISSSNHIILHIGDTDAGLINDTLIKQDVPDALLIMVGKKCSLNNPQVDLYLHEDAEMALVSFFDELYKKINQRK